MSEQNSVLKLDNLNIQIHTEYENVYVLKNISFELEIGKTLAIVGESGSGKSITALSIIRLLAPQAKIDSCSKIIFQSKNNTILDLLQCSQKEIESIRGNEISMIFQEPMTSLNPLMKCGEQIAEMIRLHLAISPEEAKKKTLQLMEEVKLPLPSRTYQKYPHELSGGQKQRIMIAMAISCRPKVLIADEATTALDVIVQHEIIDLLKELQLKYKMSILFITHDLNLVKNFADDILVLYKGEIVETGKTDAIFYHPQEPYTQALIRCRPQTNERVHFLSTVSENFSEVKQDLGNTISDVDFRKQLSKIESQQTRIELKDIKIWYPIERNFFGKIKSWHKAVDGVDLEIKNGETMGLVGESGCGKTTIGKAIVGLVDVHEGAILYQGKYLNDFSKAEWKQYKQEVQIIFQDPYSSLNPRMTVGRAIQEPMDVYGIELSKNRKESVQYLLEKVGLHANHYNRYPHEFSGGQRQRISIARALALKAELIICDESVSALDVSMQAQILNLLVSLRDEFQFTYLFISHDLNVVKHISNRVAVMQKGKIIELNNSEDLYVNPQNDYTKALLSSVSNGVR